MKTLNRILNSGASGSALLAMMAAGFGLAQSNRNSAMAAPPDGCSSPIYSENFDAGIGGWTIDNAALLGNGLWKVTAACEAQLGSHDGTNALAYVNDPGCGYAVDLGDGQIQNAGQSTSPEIDLTNATGTVNLTFSYYLESSGDSIAGITINDETLVSNQGGGLEDPSATWLTATYDISAYAGQIVRISIIFGASAPLNMDTQGGFFLDDVYVCGEIATPTESPTPTETETPTETPSPTETETPVDTESPSPTPTPADRRDVADFDSSGCTDLNDFLFLLDYWQLVSPIGGAEIGLGDFLSLLDNWTLGPNC